MKEISVNCRVVFFTDEISGREALVYDVSGEPVSDVTPMCRVWGDTVTQDIVAGTIGEVIEKLKVFDKYIQGLEKTEEK